MQQASPSVTNERNGDPRIYVVTALFFCCIAAGGVFLGLYIFLSPSDVKPWYPYAGLLLVAIPWLFWLFMYIYTCIKPRDARSESRESLTGSRSADTEAFSTGAPMKPSSDESMEHSTTGGRRVRFGGVVVIDDNQKSGNPRGDQGGEDAQHSDVEQECSSYSSTKSDEGEENSFDSRENERPLSFSVSS